MLRKEFVLKNQFLTKIVLLLKNVLNTVNQEMLVKELPNLAQKTKLEKLFATVLHILVMTLAIALKMHVILTLEFALMFSKKIAKNVLNSANLILIALNGLSEIDLINNAKLQFATNQENLARLSINLTNPNALQPDVSTVLLQMLANSMLNAF